MKRNVFLMALVLLGMFFCAQAQAQIKCNVNSGGQPNGITFDGTNIWVVNYTQNNVRKVQPTTCNVLGTFTVGSGPFGVVFDGANIWVTNFLGNSVTELNGTTGATIGTFSVGHGPRGLMFDGANIWVANYNSNTVTKLKASTGALLGTFSVGSGPYTLTFDGTNIWVANRNSNNVMQVSETGSILQTVSTGSQPQYILYVTGFIWVSCYSGNQIDSFDIAAPSVFDVINTSGFGPPTGLSTNGLNVWGVTHNGYLLQMGDSPARVENSYIIVSGYHLLSMVYDGHEFWTTAIDEGFTYELNFP